MALNSTSQRSPNPVRHGLRASAGRPGRHARHLRRRRNAARFAIVTASFAIALLLAGGGFPGPAVGVLAVGLLAGARLRRSAARAGAGARAEAQVAGQLASTRIAGLVWGHRLPGRRGDVDLIALGPCLAAIEIKHGSGRVRVDTDGTVKVGGRWLPGSPGNQALSNARALGRALGADSPADAVLCVVGMRGRPRRLELERGILSVTSSRRLGRTLRRLPARVKRSEGRRIVEALRRGSRPVSGRP